MARRFEITGDDIALLSDVDLRNLVGLLCESVAKRHSLQPSYVTWGGSQTAADGGLDVRVAFPRGTAIDGFIPRPATGFQVKKSTMNAAAIRAEMRPHGHLRPVIKELVDQEGAYIIVCSGSSTSDSALRKRREAMAAAVSDLAGNGMLKLDFYDGARLATWVRDHPGMITWVRERIGKAITGWSSYSPRAYAPDGVDAEYLLDESLRIRTSSSPSGSSVLQGIKELRDRLRQQGKVVRLIGLSGVGKTRLAQALFDDRIGEDSLDPYLAYYTNIVDDPDPQPAVLVSDLIAEHTRAIVVIDNCSPELHRRISELCRSDGSTVSAMTIEYDIREDQPEGTEAFRLEPASAGLIEKLVQRRFPCLSIVDSRSIAEFSGGNARIGIALAATVNKHETVAGLSDEELLFRLFQQRHPEDESLLLVAQACSFVYSFQGEDIDDHAELARLGHTIGKSAQELFRGAAELRRRDLVQFRGAWRAVLPHAVANRLASLALQNVPYSVIESNIVEGAPRLARSLARRLGFLHHSKEAVAIVEGWLCPGGRLGNIASLDETGSAMFNSVAPAAPESALAALERGLLGPDDEKVLTSPREYVHLLRSLAYDAPFFERCIALLLRFAEKGEDRQNASAVFASLFYLGLSGTHATIEQRLGVLEPLLLSQNIRRRELGLKALEAASKCRTLLRSTILISVRALATTATGHKTNPS